MIIPNIWKNNPVMFQSPPTSHYLKLYNTASEHVSSDILRFDSANSRPASPSKKNTNGIFPYEKSPLVGIFPVKITHHEALGIDKVSRSPRLEKERASLMTGEKGL